VSFLAATACAAAPRMPYSQALAICQGRAAAIMANSPGALFGHGHHGIIGFWALQSEDQRRETAIVNGCLAEYGWVSR
jgi:hypothetical protein